MHLDIHVGLRLCGLLPILFAFPSMPSASTYAAATTLAVVLVAYLLTQRRASKTSGPTAAELPSKATPAAVEAPAPAAVPAPAPAPALRDQSAETSAGIVTPKCADAATASAAQAAADDAAAASAKAAAAKAAAADALASRAQRIETLIEQLKPTTAGSEERRSGVADLLEALQHASTCKGKEARVLVRAFVDGGGPEVVYELESSMRGNWMRDAKNGTLKNLSAISQVQGPIGQAMSAYRRVAEKNKLDAAHQLGCEHNNAGPSPPTGAIGTLPAR